MEDNPEMFQIIEDFNRCKFSTVCSDFEKMKARIENDILINTYTGKINQLLKDNIILIIVKSSSSIPISTLASLVKENQQNIYKFVINLIKLGQLNCKIDNINHLITTNEVNSKNVVYNKTLENSNKMYNECINKILK